jgi:hypothetical protein
MSKFIITITENSTDDYLNLKDINYQKYVKIKIVNQFLEFDEKYNILPEKNIVYNPVPCNKSMFNSTEYEQLFWENYKPNGEFYCITDK